MRFSTVHLSTIHANFELSFDDDFVIAEVNSNIEKQYQYHDLFTEADQGQTAVVDWSKFLDIMDMIIGGFNSHISIDKQYCIKHTDCPIIRIISRRDDQCGDLKIKELVKEVFKTKIRHDIIPCHIYSDSAKASHYVYFYDLSPSICLDFLLNSTGYVPHWQEI